VKSQITKIQMPNKGISRPSFADSLEFGRLAFGIFPT
jgi:hypothetical protein